MLVENGSGIHVFNDQSHTLCSGTVCFVRADDHRLFESVDRLNMVNVLYRAPNGFRFLQNIAPFLPGEGQFLQLLIVLRQGCFQAHSDGNREQRLQDLLRWLQHNFSDNVDWLRLADQFQLPLRTLHRQLKQSDSDSNHFSTQFRREFSHSPKMLRQGDSGLQ